jgi:hypothetical protein
MTHTTWFGFWPDRPFIWIYVEIEFKETFVCINCQHCNMWSTQFNQWIYTDYSGSIINRTETDTPGSPTDWQDRFPVFAQMDGNSSFKMYPFISHYNSTMNITVGQIMLSASDNVRDTLEYEIFDYRAPLNNNNGWIEDQLNFGGSDSALAQQRVAGTSYDIEYLLFIKEGSPDSNNNIIDFAQWLYGNSTSSMKSTRNDLYSATYSGREWGPLNEPYGKRMLSVWTPWIAIGGSEPRGGSIGSDWFGEQRAIYIPVLEQNDSMHVLPDNRSRLPLFYRLNVFSNWKDSFETRNNFWNISKKGYSDIHITNEASYEGTQSLKVKTSSENSEAFAYRGGESSPFNFPDNKRYYASVWFKIESIGKTGRSPEIILLQTQSQSFGSRESVWKISLNAENKNFWGLDLLRNNDDDLKNFFNFSTSPIGRWQKITVMGLNQTSIRIFVNDGQVTPDFLVEHSEINYLGDLGIKDLVGGIYYDNISIDISNSLSDAVFKGELTRIHPLIPIYNYSATSPTPISRRGSLAIINGLTADGMPSLTTQLTADVWNNSDKVLFTGNVTLNTNTEIKNITLQLVRNSFDISIISLGEGEFDVRWQDRIKDWVGIYIKNNFNSGIQVSSDKDSILIHILNNSKLKSYSRGQSFPFNLTIWGHIGNASSLSDFYTIPSVEYEELVWKQDKDYIIGLQDNLLIHNFAPVSNTFNEDVRNISPLIVVLITTSLVILSINRIRFIRVK